MTPRQLRQCLRHDGFAQVGVYRIAPCCKVPSLLIVYVNGMQIHDEHNDAQGRRDLCQWLTERVVTT